VVPTIEQSFRRAALWAGRMSRAAPGKVFLPEPGRRRLRAASGKDTAGLRSILFAQLSRGPRHSPLFWWIRPTTSGRLARRPGAAYNRAR